MAQNSSLLTQNSLTFLIFPSEWMSEWASVWFSDWMSDLVGEGVKVQPLECVSE